VYKNEMLRKAKIYQYNKTCHAIIAIPKSNRKS